MALPAQQGVQNISVGSSLPALQSPLILNSSSTSPSYNKGLVIVDLFGTWCVPCIRALPNLMQIQKEFDQEVQVLLVSIESPDKLAQFIKARKNFNLPIFADEKQQWYQAFNPPALPYTAVVKDGVVLLFTEAASIDAAKIKKWLLQSPVAENSQTATRTTSVNTMQYSSNPLVKSSQQFLYAAKTEGPAADEWTKLEALSMEQLRSGLQTDDARKAFWVNVYNGYTQYQLKKNPDLFKQRNRFFKAKNIHIAGENWSLDKIEHGFLRRSQVKWGLGYLQKWFPGSTEKALRVNKRDYRIHFALNCGAASCPPIAFYNDANLDAQLDLATKAYLGSEASYDSTTNIVVLPKLMQWFRGDFGGRKGILNILEKNNVIPAGAKPQFRYRDYDWTLKL